MAPPPKGATFVPDKSARSGRQPIPKGAKVEFLTDEEMARLEAAEAKKPRRITAAEAATMDLEPVEQRPLRRISAAEAKRLGAVPVDDGFVPDDGIKWDDDRPGLTDAQMEALEAAEAEFNAAPPLPSREATPDEKEQAGGLSVIERAARYLKSRPAAIADTARNLVTTNGGVAPSFANGRFMGTLPYLSAAIDTVPAVARKVVGNSEDIGATYDRNLARIKPLYDDAEAKEPGANLIGAMTSPNLAGKATAGQRMLSAGANAGISSATAGGDPLKASALGAGVQGVAEGVSPLFKYLSEGTKDFARGRALATLSPSKADMAKLQTLGIADDVADDLYKSNAFGPLSTTEGVSKRLGPIVEQRGNALGDYINKLDARTGQTTTQPSAAVDRIRSMADEQFGKSPAFRAKAVMANREADAIAKQYGDQTLSLGDSENFLKRGYDEEAIKRITAEARGAAPSPKTDALALVREAIKKQNEDAAEAAAASMAPELSGQFVPLKQGYGRMAEAQRIADKTGGPKAANRYLSPSDYGFGIASGQAYGASPLADYLGQPVAESLSGLVGSIAHRQLRTRGSAAAASVAYPAASALGATAKAAKYAAQSPAGAAKTGNLLEEYLRDERGGDGESVDWFRRAKNGRK